jgi:electron transfer flavoprotein alpha subunit
MTSRILVSGGGADAAVQAARVALPLAKEIGAAVEAVLVGSAAPDADSQLVSELSRLTDKIHFFRVPESTPLTGAPLADALERAAADGAGLLVLGDHHFSREAAARVALRLGGPCSSMCEAITATGDGDIRIERSVYGGVALGAFKLEGSPAVCVLAPGVSAEVEGADAAADVVVHDLEPTAAAQALVKTGEEVLPRTVDLAGAKLVVSVGRGFVKPEDIAMAEELATLLNGELGCSRPIAEDFKWLPQERLVGLTGTSVAPDLYLALGISGQVQHLAGIKGAKVVAAVNNDPKCPMTRNADYVLVADLYKVLPALLDELRSRGNGG